MNILDKLAEWFERRFPDEVAPKKAEQARVGEQITAVVVKPDGKKETRTAP